MRFLKLRRVMILFALFLIPAGCGGGSGEDNWTGEPRDLTGLVSAGRSSTNGEYILQFNVPGFWVIYARQIPDTIGNITPVATSMGQNVIVETPPEHVRLFFEAFMGQGSALFSENHIPLAGQGNFRDVGGIEARTENISSMASCTAPAS